MKTTSLCRFTTNLTRHALVIILPALLIVTWLAAFGALGADKLPQNRKLTVDDKTWPKGVLELVEVKNLQATDFPKGFALVVKNISNKPIYFISFSMHLLGTGQYMPDGNSAVMPLFYGPGRLMPADSKPEPNDVPLMPGETATLDVSKEIASKSFYWLDPDSKRQLLESGYKHLRLYAQKISFGDGTGYLAGSYYSILQPAIAANRVADDPCYAQGGSTCFASDSQPSGCCDAITVRFSGLMPCKTQCGRWLSHCPQCWHIDFLGCGDPCPPQ